MEMLKLILVLAITTSPISSLVFAEDILHIDSDNLILNREKNTAVFSGDVLICFQGMKLRSQKAIFTFENQKTRKIKMITFPEKVEAIREIDGSDSVVIANEAVYTLANMELLLKGHVIIEDKKEVIVTEEMLYYGKLKNIVLNNE